MGRGQGQEEKDDLGDVVNTWDGIWDSVNIDLMKLYRVGKWAGRPSVAVLIGAELDTTERLN